MPRLRRQGKPVQEDRIKQKRFTPSRPSAAHEISYTSGADTAALQLRRFLPDEQHHPGDLNASALQSLVVDSSAKLESYSFSMEMVQNMDLVNLSSGEAQKLYTRSIGLGFTNMTDRALKLVMASLTYEKGDEENSTAIALEEYLLNDTMYIKMDGNWTVMKLPAAAAAWSQQNTMEQQVNMFKQSDLTLMGSETVDGQDCYKVRAKMDMRAYASQQSGEMASYLPMASTNNTDLFRNMTLDVYYWITKDTHLLKKTDVQQVFTLDPQSLGLPAKGPERQEMRIISETSMLFEGFNESVNIVLPPEARNAQPSPPGSVASDEAVPVASTEGEMRLSEPTSRIDESKSRLNESMSRLNQSMPDPAKLDELKSRLNESMPDPAKLNELKSRLNESMPDPAKLDELKSRLNQSMAKETRLNETNSNARKLNDSLQENKMPPATSTAWRIFF